MAKHFGPFDEEYYAPHRKEARKEKKLASMTDKSKFKKSDEDQRRKRDALVPEDETLPIGKVISITPDGIIVTCDKEIFQCTLKGVLKKERLKIKNLIAVGDSVRFEKKPSHQGAIVQVLPRHSILSRAEHFQRRTEQLIAVNVDQVLITTSVVLPVLKPALIDRYIIAAIRGKLTPIVVINKIDLLTLPSNFFDSETIEKERALLKEVVAIYHSLEIPIFCVSTDTGEGLEELKQGMQGKISVFSGQSGVGKSSLINRLTGTELPIGPVIEKTRKGSHTTTTTTLLPVGKTGWCIDTPGIRSFEIWQVTKADVFAYFHDIQHFADACKYSDCSHMHEPGCSVKEALESGKISPLRFASYSALIEDLSDIPGKDFT
jgi:ribosome biogenesis GTPase